jgi:molecular chaperone GrpE
MKNEQEKDKTIEEIKNNVNKHHEHKHEENKEIEKLKQELNLMNEKVLRLSAETQNFKRRKDEETAVMLKYANEDIVRELLPIVDNFERAIKLDDNDLSDEVSKFLSGFKMIYGSLNTLLNNAAVKEINADGVTFDPKYHQAVLTEKNVNKPSGVVLEVLQKGYMYKDKVIRPAMVKVNE